MVVLPSMDDQLLPIFRDWVIDVMYGFCRFLKSFNWIPLLSSGEIATKPANPLIDSYRSQSSFRDKLQEYKDIKELNRAGSSSPEKPRSNTSSSIQSNASVKKAGHGTNEEFGEEMTELWDRPSSNCLPEIYPSIDRFHFLLNTFNQAEC